MLPQFRNKSKSDVVNYRPISVTSVLAKVMENIINQRLIRHFEENKLLNDNQYGFRNNRSTGDLMTFPTDSKQFISYLQTI